MKYVIMSGNKYGSFTLAGNKPGGMRVKDVSWQGGKQGIQSATRFPDEEAAEYVADQVRGVKGAPIVVEEPEPQQRGHS
jgi:hypothetical protein